MPSESATVDEVLQAVQSLSATAEGFEDKLVDLDDKLSGLSDVVSGLDVTGVDYTTAIQQIIKMLAITDLMLIVLVVFMFLGCGLFFGYQVTRWMKADD